MCNAAQIMGSWENDEKCLSSCWDLLKLEEITGVFFSEGTSEKQEIQHSHYLLFRWSRRKQLRSSEIECQAFTDYHKRNHYCFIVFPQSPKAKTDCTSELQNKPSAPWEEDAPQRYRTESSKWITTNTHTTHTHTHTDSTSELQNMYFISCI